MGLDLETDVIEWMWGEWMVWLGKGPWSVLAPMDKVPQDENKTKSSHSGRDSCVILVRLQDRATNFSQVPLWIGRGRYQIWVRIVRKIVSLVPTCQKEGKILLQGLCRKVLEKGYQCTYLTVLFLSMLLYAHLFFFGLFRVPWGSQLVILWNQTVCEQEDESSPLYSQPGKCVCCKNLARIAEKQWVNIHFQIKTIDKQVSGIYCSRNNCDWQMPDLVDCRVFSIGIAMESCS